MSNAGFYVGCKMRPFPVDEIKAPWVVEGKTVLQRRLPEGNVVARFGPFPSEPAAEAFVLERQRQRALKAFQIGDSEHGHD